jgi:hypothetical protein
MEVFIISLEFDGVRRTSKNVSRKSLAVTDSIPVY